MLQHFYNYYTIIIIDDKMRIKYFVIYKSDNLQK